MSPIRRLFPLLTLALISLWAGGLSSVAAQDSHPIVVLDPGHGWVNESGTIVSGAVSGDLVEKDINLDVAQHARTFLSRCPVEVELTREGDDHEHTLDDLAGLVNSAHPTIGISIHTNSGTGSPSGTEGWYTVDGYDDVGSQQLATLLAGNVSSRLEIANRGIMPETSNRHEGLYIHYWQAPSALVEIGFLQGDAALLRDRRADFGRAVAASALSYLDMPATCADSASLRSPVISTYFPGDSRTNQIELVNDGLVAWGAGDYSLVNVRNPFGANSDYPLGSTTAVGDTASWEIPATAPSRPGVHRQVWQLQRNGEPIGDEVTVFVIVIPEKARELKEDVDRQIEEWRERGEQELEALIDELEKQVLAWVEREAQSRLSDCPSASVIVVMSALNLAFWQFRKPNHANSL